MPERAFDPHYPHSEPDVGLLVAFHDDMHDLIRRGRRNVEARAWIGNEEKFRDLFEIVFKWDHVAWHARLH